MVIDLPCCTFFGHRACPAVIKDELRIIMVNLIEKNNVDLFYVCNAGGFDRMVRSVLHELETAHPQIRYAVVLAYMPPKKSELYEQYYSDTMFGKYNYGVKQTVLNDIGT